MRNKKASLSSRLVGFIKEYEIQGKGPLSVVIVLTRKAKGMTPPFDSERFLTANGGQVSGLSRAAVQKVLKDYGIERVLAEEGGRTSRGSISNMQGYIRLLNHLHNEKMLDLDEVEKWWIQKIVEHFSSQPLRIKNDQSKSLASLIDDLMSFAYQRQKEQKGTMVAGAVMQHMVGAKLAIILPDIEIEHKGFSVADEQGGRKGDFLVADAAFHVTTAPTEALIRKCSQNLRENLRPIIITTYEGMGGAKALAKNSEIIDRIDMFEISQFIATNLYELCGFKQSDRPVKITDLINAYNEIIDATETDPSLKIMIG